MVVAHLIISFLKQVAGPGEFQRNKLGGTNVDFNTMIVKQRFFLANVRSHRMR